jgi:hypothetical protein
VFEMGTGVTSSLGPPACDHGHDHNHKHRRGSTVQRQVCMNMVRDHVHDSKVIRARQ